MDDGDDESLLVVVEDVFCGLMGKVHMICMDVMMCDEEIMNSYTLWQTTGRRRPPSPPSSSSYAFEISFASTSLTEAVLMDFIIVVRR